MTGNEAVCVAHRVRRFDAAAGAGSRTARVERATRRWIERIGHHQAEPSVRYAEPRLGSEHAVEQGARIGMAGCTEQRGAIGLLDDPAEIHHGDAGRHVLDHREIVADEHISEAEIAAQIEQAAMRQWLRNGSTTTIRRSAMHR